MPEIVKERIYAEKGVLKRADGNYSISATDVRYVKFNKNSYTLKLVWSKGKTVSQLIKENGADYAFNFPYFYNDNPIADCKIGNTILSQGYDKVNGAQMTKWHGFQYKDGQPSIGLFNVKDDVGSDGFIIDSSPLLINNGNPCWDYYRVQDGTATDIGKDANGYVRSQRTFIGLDAQGNLHLAVADGRTKYDAGLTLEEMALYMASKGAITSLNGDGGGSSVIADKTGSLGQNKGADERAVNHAVLVFMNKANTTPTTTTPTTKPVTPIPTQGGSTMEQWKLDSLKELSQFKQKNGDPYIDYDTWVTKLNENTPIWLMVELIKRVIENK